MRTTNAREALPARRRCDNFTIEHGNLAGGYAVNIGYYDDGSIGEVFINGGKSGQTAEAIARDGAILLSIALQYGVSLEDIKRAITRDSRGEPLSIIGAVVDRLLPNDGR